MLQTHFYQTVPLEETFGSGGFGGFGKRAKCGVDRCSLGFYDLEFLYLNFSKMWISRIFCILVGKWITLGVGWVQNGVEALFEEANETRANGAPRDVFGVWFQIT